MEAVGELIEMDIPFTKIIDETFFQKTYIQNQILGRCLLESVMILGGRCLFTVISRKMLRFYSAVAGDLEGVVEQLRITKGVEVAILLYEMSTMEYKVSMRSKDIVDVSKIAEYFGGGGHVRAAGCTMKGSAHDALNNLTKHIENALENAI
jgi:phosphoesterase RecJ-like protein